MKNVHVALAFTHVPQVLKRGRQSLIVVKDEQNHYVLGSKNIYPEGIHRFVGGGVERGESPDRAALRELKEELDLDIIIDKDTPPVHIATVSANILESTTHASYYFETFLYSFQVRGQKITPADDLDGVVHYDLEHMHQLIENYNNLPTQLISLGNEAKPPETFRWSDYGKYFGPVHQLGVELTQ